MITQHESFPAPKDRDVSIWRYMDFAKFVWMLQKRALYFCRCDLLGDPYEGYYTKALAEGEDEFVRNMLAATKEIKPETEAAFRSAFKSMLTFTKSMRQELFVSCWHMNEAESSAMWKLYTSHGDSICVRSTFATFANLLDARCFLGEVRYIDYARGIIGMGNLLNYIMHKRLSFQHEREARAVIWQNKQKEKKYESVEADGLIVPIDTHALISEVFVSPQANPMLREVVERIARDYGIKAPVRQSEVNAPPTY